DGVASARVESRDLSAEPPCMRAEAALYRNSARFFALFLLGLVLAFWPSYFARLFEQPSLFFHLHGVALTLWVVMLVAQAQLIRTGRRPLHRQIGKASYVLAPAVVAITVSFVHYRVAGSLPSFERLPPFVPYFLALTLNSLIVFAAFYTLAIYHRRDAGRHARWMISTAFPLFTPITDRLIGGHWPALAALAPRIDGSPILPVFGFALADLILLGLAAWDWRANRRVDVFASALAVLALYHLSALTLYRVPAWGAFCSWFLSLPLS
ncbi:MAG TPA: hypothetical protein VMV37_01925, partial [Gammaproteobacteria bacterium]|nr:hypothetical protein [Gammaproteobacteria bacterium]